MRTPRIVDVPLRFARAQIVLGDVPTLVDTGDAGDVPRLLAAIRGAGLELRDIRRIILTHADGSHAGGARRLQDLTGAEVAVHAAERSYLAGELPQGFGVVKRAAIAIYQKAEPPDVGRWLAHGDVLDGIEVLHTPGHTPGHVSLLAGTALIAGDAFATGQRCKETPRSMSADASLARDSIYVLAERDILTAFSGHGEPIGDAGEKLRLLAAKLTGRRSNG